MKGLFALALVSSVLYGSVFAAENVTATVDTDGDGNPNNNVADSNRAPIECFECSSHPEKEGEACNDPMDRETIKKATCASGVCLKYYQNVENKIHQINRGCAAELEPVLVEKEKEEGCVLSTGTKLIQVQICNCLGQGCNGAREVRSASSIIVAAALVCMLAKLVH